MPLGIVSDDELEDELRRLGQKESHQNTGLVVDKPQRGRGNALEVPDSLRKIIGEEAVINGRQSALDLAKEWNISPSQVSAYAKGATSTATYNTPSKSIISHINKSRQRAVKRASSTLHHALSSITQDKLDYADAKDLAGIAKDMSVIIKNLEPQPEAVKEPTQSFVIYAPQFRKEETFETIVVNE